MSDCEVVSLSQLNAVVNLFYAAAPALRDNETCEKIWPELSGGNNMPEHHIHLKYTEFYKSDIVLLWQYLDPENKRRLYNWLCQNFSDVPQAHILYDCASLLNIISYHMGFRQFCEVWTDAEDAEFNFCAYKQRYQSNAVLFFKALSEKDQLLLFRWCCANRRSFLTV